jgi:hypothetical protein
VEASNGLKGQQTRIASLPQNALLSREPEQRKSPTGLYPFPVLQVVHIPTQSRGLDKDQQKASQNPLPFCLMSLGGTVVAHPTPF